MPEGPRSMRNGVVVEARRAMLSEPHIRPLTAYVTRLRQDQKIEYPYFDPADGGINASLLFLFEKPGPMTSASKSGRPGSGFISRDNDDPTAEATHRFMAEAGIPRTEVALWNVIPGWNGTRAISRDELVAGVGEVRNLLALLPGAKAIVLVGKKAQRADRLLRAAGWRVFHSAHPSPLVRASRPDEWRAIPARWAEAWRAVPL